MTVRCNNCMWTGADADLQRQICAVDGEMCDACPSCGTDHYLMDLDEPSTSAERDMHPHPDSPDDYWLTDDEQHVVCAHCGRKYEATGDEAFKPAVDQCSDDCPQYG